MRCQLVAFCVSNLRYHIRLNLDAVGSGAQRTGGVSVYLCGRQLQVQLHRHCITDLFWTGRLGHQPCASVARTKMFAINACQSTDGLVKCANRHPERTAFVCAYNVIISADRRVLFLASASLPPAVLRAAVDERANSDTSVRLHLLLLHHPRVLRPPRSPNHLASARRRRTDRHDRLTNVLEHGCGLLLLGESVG